MRSTAGAATLAMTAVASPSRRPGRTPRLLPPRPPFKRSHTRVRHLDACRPPRGHADCRSDRRGGCAPAPATQPVALKQLLSGVTVGSADHHRGGRAPHQHGGRLAAAEMATQVVTTPPRDPLELVATTATSRIAAHRHSARSHMAESHRAGTIGDSGHHMAWEDPASRHGACSPGRKTPTVGGSPRWPQGRKGSGEEHGCCAR